jgi:hypothetical protein
MTRHPGLTPATWRKSSRSGGSGGNCVEIAQVDRDDQHPTDAH